MALPAPHRFSVEEYHHLWLVDVAGQATEVCTAPGPDGHGDARWATGADTAAPGALPDPVPQVGNLFATG